MKKINLNDKKFLILHADDLGLNHCTNQATIQLLKQKKITSTSLMAPCPWVYEAASQTLECPNGDFGVHVTLNSEWKNYRWGPVSSSNQVPSLIDSHGMLWPTREEFARHAQKTEVLLEVERQIKKLLQLGVKLSHIDTHMGTIATIPEFLEEYVRIAKDFGLLPMLVRWSPQFESYLKGTNRYPVIELKKIFLRLEAEGMILLDRLILDVGGETREERKQNYLQTLKTLPLGLSQIIVHLSHGDEEFHPIIQERPYEFRRQIDVDILQEDEVQETIHREGIVLIGWKDLY